MPSIGELSKEVQEIRGELRVLRYLVIALILTCGGSSVGSALWQNL